MLEIMFLWISLLCKKPLLPPNPPRLGGTRLCFSPLTPKLGGTRLCLTLAQLLSPPRIGGLGGGTRLCLSPLTPKIGGTLTLAQLLSPPRIGGPGGGSKLDCEIDYSMETMLETL